MMKCKNTSCPIKEKCSRYSEIAASNYYTDPSITEHGMFKCDKYKGDAVELFFLQFQQAVNKSNFMKIVDMQTTTGKKNKNDKK